MEIPEDEIAGMNARPEPPPKRAGSLSINNVPLPVLPDNKDIRERAKAVEDDIFATYYRIMMSETAPVSVRKSCADALADRARGKPAQSVEHTGRVQFEALVIQRSAARVIDHEGAEEPPI